MEAGNPGVISNPRLRNRTRTLLNYQDSILENHLRQLFEIKRLKDEVKAIKLRKLARVQEIKDQMKAAGFIHDASIRFKVDQENEILQQAIKFVEEVTGLQRNIGYAQRQL
jgi:hypothetical protein